MCVALFVYDLMSEVENYLVLFIRWPTLDDKLLGFACNGHEARAAHLQMAVKCAMRTKGTIVTSREYRGFETTPGLKPFLLYFARSRIRFYSMVTPYQASRKSRFPRCYMGIRCQHG